MSADPQATSAASSRDEALDEARALLEDAEAELAEIEQAIDASALGARRPCEVCGSEIEAERLVVDPSATRCAEHAVVV